MSGLTERRIERCGQVSVGMRKDIDRLILMEEVGKGAMYEADWRSIRWKEEKWPPRQADHVKEGRNK